MTRYQLPDGRQYQVTYGQWNNLTQVITPDGAAQTFGYGDVTESTDTSCAPGTNFFKQGLQTATSYPQGLSGPGYTTTTDIGATTNLNRTTNPDGSVIEEMKFYGTGVVQPSWPAPYYYIPSAQSVVDRTLQTEHCSGPCNGNNLIEGSYYADHTDGTGSYLTWDTASTNGTSSPIPSWSMLDIRPTKVRHKKCDAGTCVTWWRPSPTTRPPVS